jgi:hypothetical protein
MSYKPRNIVQASNFDRFTGKKFRGWCRKSLCYNEIYAGDETSAVAII